MLSAMHLLSAAPESQVLAAMNRLTDLLRARPALRRLRFDEGDFERQVLRALPVGQSPEVSAAIAEAAICKLVSRRLTTRFEEGMARELSAADLTSEDRIALWLGVLTLQIDRRSKNVGMNPALECILRAQLEDRRTEEILRRTRILQKAGIDPRNPEAVAGLLSASESDQRALTDALQADPEIAPELAREMESLDRELEGLFRRRRIPPVMLIDEWLLLLSSLLSKEASPAARVEEFERCVGAELQQDVGRRLQLMAQDAQTAEERWELNFAHASFQSDPVRFLWLSLGRGSLGPFSEEEAEAKLVQQLFDSKDSFLRWTSDQLEPLRLHLEESSPARAARMAQVQARLNKQG